MDAYINFKFLTFLEVCLVNAANIHVSLVKKMAKFIFFVKMPYNFQFITSSDLLLFRLMSLCLVRHLVTKAGVGLPIALGEVLSRHLGV